MSQNLASCDVDFWDIGIMQQVRFLRCPIEANAQLREWGLERELLKEVVYYAQSFSAECTANDPPGFDRVMAYSRAGRRMRELLMPMGWVKDTSNNQTAIRHEDYRLRIYPCNFCSFTSNPNHSPVNLTEKGAAARRDTDCNAQLSLFASPEMLPDAESSSEPYRTLLLGMNFEEENAKAELSLPVKFMRGKFTGLAIRVPILDGTEVRPLPTKRMVNEDAFEEIDIAISPKS